jgi:GST-like protein
VFAINRYTNEAKRLYNVIDKQLSTSAYLAGEEYTIADIATFPWLRAWKRQGIEMDDFPHLKNWFGRIAERPAVKRGLDALTVTRKPMDEDPKAREMLFGATQYALR